MLHTGITSGCGQCHGGTHALTWYNNYTPKDGVLAPAHIPVLRGHRLQLLPRRQLRGRRLRADEHDAAKHAFVPTTCDTCHEAGLSFYMGAATPALQGRPADHTSGQMVAPNDCSLCHTTANWNSTALPAGHMPNPGGQQCTVCHTAAPARITCTLASNAVLHTGITTGCAQCHGGATQLTFYNNNDNPKSAVLTPPHIPAFTGTDCSTCHTPPTMWSAASGR